MSERTTEQIIFKEQRTRSIVKGVSWRFIATSTTTLISYMNTGSVGNALNIGFWEFLTKIGLFYIHERIWFLIKWGTTWKIVNNVAKKTDSHSRSVFKGVSWRIFATTDTIIIALLVTHDWTKALEIGAWEFSIKVILFYLHERIWHLIKWGQKSHVVEVSGIEIAPGIS